MRKVFLLESFESAQALRNPGAAVKAVAFQFGYGIESLLPLQAGSILQRALQRSLFELVVAVIPTFGCTYMSDMDGAKVEVLYHKDI